MFKLHNLPKIIDKRNQRIARGYGSGRGAKSGRGTTRHQAARENIPLMYEGGQNRMVKKYPLLRGKLKNKSIGPKNLILSVDELDRIQKGGSVSLETLVKSGTIKGKNIRGGVKIIGTGKVDKSYSVSLPVSQGARKSIEKAGGKIEETNVAKHS